MPMIKSFSNLKLNFIFYEKYNDVRIIEDRNSVKEQP